MKFLYFYFYFIDFFGENRFENDDVYNLKCKEDNPIFKAINDKLNDNLVKLLTEIPNEQDQIKKVN